ncbi:Ig-like domain-containing protein [Parapedobacter lycopersici]|uniref:Ig-like domain-containing protein n=1 Tax=Parapedobacter lycopersici TaxID=1864939 RepID=UPI00214D25EF|nr:hypothetical protein [Parapedobacter lycopersici]
MYAHILSYIFPAARMAFLVTLLCLGVVREGYGQRVYADAHSEANGLLGGSVSDEGRAVDNDYNNFSTLNVGVGLLNLMYTTQNLNFSGTTNPKPQNTSPIILKFSSTGSIANLIGGISIQRTNNGLTNTVGTEYTSSALLTLLNGSVASEVIIPIPGVSTSSDGVRLRISTVLGLGLQAHLYYAFYITPPQVPSSLTICANAPESVTITNFQTGYTYRLYNQQIGGAEVGVTTTSNILNIPGSLAAGTYYLEAREGDLYPSARTPITLARNEVSSGLITANQILCSNVTPAQLTPTTPASGSGTLTYQWQSRTSSGSFQDISGATGLTYSPPSLTETMIYRRVATSTLNGIACQANSNDITITVYPVPGISLASSTIEACQGDDVNLTYITTMNGPISYSIDWNAQAEGAGFVDIFNETYSFLTTEDTIPITVLPGIATGNYQGILTVRNSNGCTSNGQIIMINILPKPPAPEITVQ